MNIKHGKISILKLLFHKMLFEAYFMNAKIL